VEHRGREQQQETLDWVEVDLDISPMDTEGLPKHILHRISCEMVPQIVIDRDGDDAARMEFILSCHHIGRALHHELSTVGSVGRRAEPTTVMEHQTVWNHGGVQRWRLDRGERGGWSGRGLAVSTITASAMTRVEAEQAFKRVARLHSLVIFGKAAKATSFCSLLEELSHLRWFTGWMPGLWLRRFLFHFRHRITCQSWNEAPKLPFSDSAVACLETFMKEEVG
jgi:hypothetical protein